jgi:hypothetical protein
LSISDYENTIVTQRYPVLVEGIPVLPAVNEYNVVLFISGLIAAYVNVVAPVGIVCLKAPGGFDIGPPCIMT